MIKVPKRTGNLSCVSQQRREFQFPQVIEEFAEEWLFSHPDETPPFATPLAEAELAQDPGGAEEGASRGSETLL